MIIVDANIWIDHFRLADPHLLEIGEEGSLRMHPYTVGELARLATSRTTRRS